MDVIYETFFMWRKIFQPIPIIYIRLAIYIYYRYYFKLLTLYFTTFVIFININILVVTPHYLCGKVELFISISLFFILMVNLKT